MSNSETDVIYAIAKMMKDAIHRYGLGHLAVFGENRDQSCPKFWKNTASCTCGADEVLKQIETAF